MSLVASWEPAIFSVSGGMSVVWLWHGKGGGSGLLNGATTPVPGIVGLVVVLKLIYKA